MTVSSTEHLDKLAFILYDRPAGRNIIGYAIEKIEKLRADLATQQGCCDGAAAQDAHVRQEREEHRAEIERLRAALRECACACSSIRECGSEWTKENHCLHLNARKALEGKP